jgi:uncharacterized protein YjlB
MKLMKRALFIFSSIIILLTSCEKWLDVNVNPNSPADVELNQILPGVFFDIGDDLGLGYNRLGYVTGVYTHQLTTRESYDQYGVTGGSYAMTTYWSDLYAGVLPMLDILIEKGEETDNLHYAGIGKVMKAYVVSQMVDIWGDIPYSQINIYGNFNPTFDDDQVIYTDLFTMLDDGLDDLNDTISENLNEPGDDDLIYAGDIDTWVKAANSIKLKLYNQVRNTTLYDATDVAALIADDANLIEEGEDFWIPFGASVAPDNRNPAFVSEYSGAQISNYISPWFWEMMHGDNANILQGISDPRVPYYFATQLGAGEDTESQPEYRDGNFVTIYFGSTGTNRDHGGRNTFTMMGLYPCGGAYDLDVKLDKDDPLGITAGTGAAPYKMISYSDVLYIRAELAQVGLTGDVARDFFEDAMEASFEQVDAISLLAALPTATVPALSGSGVDATYIADVLAQFDAGSTDKQLEHIMTQKWIAAWGSSIDSYTDYRRTGYPVMWDPNTMAALADGGPDGSGVVPVVSGRAYAVSMPWSADELSLNPNAPSAQKLVSTEKVFWDD